MENKISLNKNPTILVVDDDLSLLRVLEHHLLEAGYQVHREQSANAAHAKIVSINPQILISDLRMPEMTGLQLQQRCRDLLPDLMVILLTGFPNVEDAVEAMRMGAYDFIQKPVDREHLLQVVKKASDLLALRKENTQLRNLVENFLGFDNMVGQSEAMKKVYEQARQMSQSSAPVMILGETGTGKELLAKAIHRNGNRSSGPFIAVNCAAIPGDLLEAELFGYRKGAFTGAHIERSGKVLAAQGGSLFLDEIGDMPLDLQPKLLRVLQEKKVDVLGDVNSVSVDFRLICSTHRDLKQLINDGKFREDLFYRLNVVPITLPPLRERRNDIPLLFIRFLKMESERENKVPLTIDQDLLQALAQLNWFGNVRELENLAKRLVALNTSGKITVSELPELNQKNHPDINNGVFNQQYPVLPVEGFDIETWTDTLILAALKKHEWNQSRTAKYLNISRNTLTYRIDKRGLQREDEVSRASPADNSL